MFCSKKKFCLFLFFLSFLGFAKPEYIVYQLLPTDEVASISDEKLHSKVYNILMTYQFPMNTNPALNLNLTKEEETLLNKDERAFLEYKLRKEVANNLQVLFVPTTLYELFFIGHYKDFVNIDKSAKEYFLSYFSPLFTKLVDAECDAKDNLLRDDRIFKSED